MVDQGQVIVRTYRGNQDRAMAAFRADATSLAESGYFPTSQSWVPGAYGCGSFLVALLLCFILIGIVIFIYMLIVKPDGTLTVTYEKRAGWSNSERIVSAKEKTCPRCAEQVKAAATACRFCGYEFPPPTPGESPSQATVARAEVSSDFHAWETERPPEQAPPAGLKVNKKFLILGVGLMALVLVGIGLAQKEPQNAQTSTADASNSATNGATQPLRDPPDSFRGIGWNSKLPSVSKWRKTILIGCSGLSEQNNFVYKTPCIHQHIDTDDLDLFTQRQNLSPFFGIPVSAQQLEYSYRKFWSGELFIKNYRETDLAKLRSALIAQYGSPTFENDSLRITKWQWPEKKLEIELTFDSLAMGTMGPGFAKNTTISLSFSKRE